MSTPEQIIELVERFDRNLDSYRSGKYNEAQVRQEFINPFFETLGWDIYNRQGYAEAYKDVIHEDAIKVGSATKAPDYCFRIGGTRKFFLEAKKPAVNIREDISPAYQLRRYAWSAKLPLSILTDFEEFAVYDSRIKPVRTDKASTARIFYLTYTDYINRWDEIASIFSRDAILKGSFDRYVESSKVKRGTAGVDTAFLEEIDRWREVLARNIALRNSGLKKRELNFAVQRTIDRIVFLRICEDRGIEPYGRLMSLRNGTQTYRRLCQIFQQADDRYNSGLFHFRKEKDRTSPPDDLTLDLTIDDKTLKDIFRNLYYPDSPYEFSVLPADILGQVYERFLGKVIRLTSGNRAVVEDKPEVKKAGGVYYTPTYIVDYIVKQTVGKLIEGKKPGPRGAASKLKILDPACGSGSFLIGAYQYLLDWHRDQYITDSPEKWAKGRKPRLYQGPGGDWRLTTDERKRILLNNIYGVDIDSQAVEVTKLSLLLKVLEDESAETIGKTLELFHERALPDLGSNIKCGNSLIGPDFYEGQQVSFLDEEEMYRINAFDWEAEFKEIMQDGGFDAVIGNPPWGAVFTNEEIVYFREKNREIIVRMIDSFMYFIYQNSKRIKDKGIFGMIIPDVLLYQIDNQKLRKFITENFRLESILNLGNGVFYKVTRPSAIIVYSSNTRDKNHKINIANLSNIDGLTLSSTISDESNITQIQQSSIRDIPGYLFVTEKPYRYKILKKVTNIKSQKLGDLVDEDGIQRGVSPDFKKAFIVDVETAKQEKLELEKLRNVLTGGNHAKKYYINYPNLRLIYTTRSDDFETLPNIRRFINQFSKQISCKEVKTGKHPLYALHRPRNEGIFLKQIKLIGVITEDEIIIAPDTYKTFATDGLYLFGLKETIEVNYILAVLNSKLFTFVYRLLALEAGRVLAQVKPSILKQLPIRTINFSDTTDKARHDRMVELVEQMLDLNKRLAETKEPQTKTVLQRQIETTDRQIDRLVYELYELTEEEIRIVEGS